MNDKLYAICAGLSDEVRKRDAGAFFGSIHGTLNHLLLADYAWMRRFTGHHETYCARTPDGTEIDVTSLDQILYDDFDALRRERERVDGLILDWSKGLRDDDLRAPLSYRTSAGERYEHPLWWAVSHFFNHQTHHRGQLTTLLLQVGEDPGVTDLVALLRGSA
jgi:uncharacterized damage-inducible protein DinB